MSDRDTLATLAATHLSATIVVDGRAFSARITATRITNKETMPPIEGLDLSLGSIEETRPAESEMRPDALTTSRATS